MGVCASRRWPSLTEFYELDSPEVVLGEGACSRVFRARKRASGELVAIKRLDKAQQRLIDDDPLQWEREVALLRRCASHPNVVALHDVMETAEYVYIIMELAEGGELFQALIDEGAYSEWDARRFMMDLLEALRFLHELGIAHRDIKPENLLLTSMSPKHASIKLADFGLAALVEESSLLSNGRMTWAYCAPEVFKTASPAEAQFDLQASQPEPVRNPEGGVQSDMWSVGIVLYVLLSGTHPFDPDGRQTRDQMISSIQSGQFSMVSPRWDAISSEAKELISALLQISPDARPTASQALHFKWFKSQHTSRQSLAVSISDTEGLEQYRHLMRRKFRSRQSAGSADGDQVAGTVVPLVNAASNESEGPPVGEVASPYISSPSSTSASDVPMSVEKDSKEFPPVATHSVLRTIFHHDAQEELGMAEVVTATSAAEVDITVDI
ncbi:unnamed protein product [Phytophthora lilii]|uniref:Unnamed protein product n=1 Tax=Phytophthora lilii TaxID=2077276 RepID=A0A9W6TXK9_9STRA|nr:unnamed protein product [Phytophthora lilii]